MKKLLLSLMGVFLIAEKTLATTLEQSAPNTLSEDQVFIKNMEEKHGIVINITSQEDQKKYLESLLFGDERPNEDIIRHFKEVYGRMVFVAASALQQTFIGYLDQDGSFIDTYLKRIALANASVCIDPWPLNRQYGVLGLRDQEGLAIKPGRRFKLNFDDSALEPLLKRLIDEKRVIKECVENVKNIEPFDTLIFDYSAYQYTPNMIEGMGNLTKPGSLIVSPIPMAIQDEYIKPVLDTGLYRDLEVIRLSDLSDLHQHVILVKSIFEGLLAKDNIKSFIDKVGVMIYTRK